MVDDHGRVDRNADAGVAGVPVRRTPRQARSKEKLARVLEAADRLLVAEGAEALTTTRVAAEAGVSVGALYQYLPDRDAIVDTLADRYLARLETLMDSFVDRASRESWPDPAAVLVDAFAGLYRSEPGLRALWFGHHLTERTREADRVHKHAMAIGVHRILVAQRLLPDDAAAAAMVRRSAWEPRPENTVANHTVPPLDFRPPPYPGLINGPQVFDRISGNFTGTTDEIIQWAAC